MSKLRHILRLHAHRKGTKEISKQTGVARNTVKKYIAKYKELGCSINEINALDDFALNELFGKSTLKYQQNPIDIKN